MPPLPSYPPPNTAAAPPYTDKYVTVSPREKYILRTWRDGMTQDIFDQVSGTHLTRVTYTPITDRNARGALRTIYYDVYKNGKLYLRYDPSTYYFDAITMKVYPLRK
jgi:hypothetical protein